MVRVVACTGCCREGRREFRMIKDWCAGSFRGLDEQKLAAFRGGDPIPEAFIGHPCRSHTGTKHERVRVVRHPLLGPRVIRKGERAWRIAALLGHGGKRGREE